MILTRAIGIAACAAAASAHFQLQFPDPRGQFVEDDEPKFCDGYNSPAKNRTVFPLHNGFLSLNSEHESWVAAVFLTTSQNPTSFDDFKQIVPFFQVKGSEGLYCIPLDFNSPNATGLTSGQNVTLEVLFSGGDGNLYQCSDLTLSDNFTISSDIKCSNATSQGDSSATTTSTTPGSTQSSPSGAGRVGFTVVGGLLSLLGTVMIL